MDVSTTAIFTRNYERLLQHLRLKGMQPKTIDAYSRAVRQAGVRFNQQIEDLSAHQLTDYFSERLATHSWSAVKLDLYGLRFFYEHVLAKPWPAPGLVKPPKSQRLPDILTVGEMQRLIAATRVVSYRALFFAIYSLGLRLGEALSLEVGDIDGARARVHIRDAKGNKDRFVPLPKATHQMLRRFWQTHRNPVLLFPSRVGGVAGGACATKPLDRGGVAESLRQVLASCGLKKRSRRTRCAMPLPPT